MGGDGPPGVGTRYTTTRRIAGIVPTGTTSEITEIDQPRRWAARGAGGPVRETVSYTVEPLEGNGRSQVTIELDFEGRGIGRLLVPLVVRRQARKEIDVHKLPEAQGTAGEWRLKEQPACLWARHTGFLPVRGRSRLSTRPRTLSASRNGAAGARVGTLQHYCRRLPRPGLADSPQPLYPETIARGLTGEPVAPTSFSGVQTK